MTHPSTTVASAIAADADIGTARGVRSDTSGCPGPTRPVTAPPVGRRVNTTEHHLAALSDRITAAADVHGARIAAAGVHPIPSGIEFRRVDAADWLLCPVADDPILHRRGHMPMPEQVHSNLRRLLDIGMDFPTVVVAHQLTPASTATTAEAVLAAPGRPATARQATARLADPSPHPAATRAAQSVERVASSMLRAAVATGRGAGGVLGAIVVAPLALAALDPIILGAVTCPGTPHRTGVPAAWFELGRWDW